MIFLLAYLYVQYVILLPMITYMNIRRMNTFGNWFIDLFPKTILLTKDASLRSGNIV